MPFNNYLGAVEAEKRSLTPEGERLRGSDEVVTGWGAYHSLDFWLISVKHAFV